MKKNIVGRVSVSVMLSGIMLMCNQGAVAALTAKELADLDSAKYTPMGAIREGNADKTIPEWVNKPLKVPAGKNAKDLPDAFADEKPLFTITAENYEKYKDKLLPGQVAMLKQYPKTFRMHVYPTHRTATYDPWIYEATKRQAEKIELHPDQVSKGVVALRNIQPGGGIPFPFPKNGDEAEWSHWLAYHGIWANGVVLAALMDSNGQRTDVVSQNRESRPYWIKKEDVDKYPLFKQMGYQSLCPSLEVLMPPRSAGLLNGGCVGIADFALNVYLYLPGQRRVRRAPEIGLHDSPSFGSDGMRTIAGWYMGYFGGHDSHHDRKLVGLREAFIPYNNFKLASDEATPDKLFLAKHINQDLVRYELHRVWEVDAVRKPGIRDLYKRHVSYYDEDTWQGVAMEVYDSSDRLWRVGEQYLLYYYGINAVIPYGDVAVDLINGRYTTFPFWYRQAEKMVGRPGFTISSDSTKPLFVLEDYYTPQGLRKSGMR